MKTNVLSIAALALAATLTACNSKQDNITDRIELPGTVDNEVFADCIESISVMNLQMDNSWLFEDGLTFGLSDNCMYMLGGMQQINLVCLDRHTGEKLAGRTINGNGPGEIRYLNSAFCIGDTLCILDNDCVLRQYDSNGRFLGKMHEFGESERILDMFRLPNGDYALIYLDTHIPDSIPGKVALTDKSFNVKARHFDLPRVSFFFSIGGLGNPYCVNGNTIRFLFYGHLDNHLYTLCGDTEQCTELVLPNPQTAERFIEITNEMKQKHGGSTMNKLFELDGFFGNLCESGRFVGLGYQKSNQKYFSLIDKHTNSAISAFSEEEQRGSLMHSLYWIFNNMQVLHSDGEYIYTMCKNRDLAALLEGHDDELNNYLQKTQTEYRAYLERNAEYMKDLEPEERDAANVILKIKLKD